MPTRVEIVAARGAFMARLERALQAEGCQTRVDLERQGVHVVDDRNGGWGYFVGVCSYAIVTEPGTELRALTEGVLPINPTTP